MSSSLNRIKKNIIEAIQSANNQGTSAYDSVAEVRRVEGDTAWVHIAGGVDETPVKLTIAAKAGDMVQVRVGGGRAWITGNASAPPTDDKTAIAAKGLANLAGNRANTAKATADTAQSTADAAKASASSAANAASAAQTKANEAASAAATAQSKADSAGTAAAKAQSSANAAGEAASSAQAAAEAAQVAAGATQADIDSQKEYFWHDANGAHVLGSKTAATRYRTDVDSEGMHIKDVSGEIQEIAKFTASGAQIGKDGNRQAIVDEDGLHVSTEGETYFHAGYSSDAIDAEGKATTAPFYTEGSRKSGSGVGSYSHAEGLDVTASGYSSHAEGQNTTASNPYSHAEGQNTTASNSYSHAEGKGTTASGYSSHAEGFNVKASGNYSHAQNKDTIAAYDAQTAIGKYNSNSEGNALEIGNGTDTTDRSNAFAVDWYGNVTASGTISDSNGNLRSAIDGKANTNHTHGWIDITDSCDFAVTVDKTSKYRSFMKYNPDTKEVKGVLYVKDTVTNQGRILTLPSSVSNSFRGLCGIASTKSTSMLVTPRIDGQIIYSSHTVNSSVTEVIYLIDFAT